MKKNIIIIMCVMFMVLGVMSSAYSITIGPNTQVQWTWQSPNPSPFSDPKYDNPDASVVSWVVGVTVNELYRV